MQQRSDTAIHKVLLVFHNYEKEETNQIKFYSNNKSFVHNSLKQNLLLNVQDFVPKIFSCDSSSIGRNIDRSVGQSVGRSAAIEFQKHFAANAISMQL